MDAHGWRKLSGYALLAAGAAELACVASGSVECSRAASLVGSSAGGVFLAVLAYTLWRGVEGLRLALAMVLAASAAGFIKQVVNAPRPPSEYWLVEAEGPSFPSGHATASAALAASLALSMGLDPPVTLGLAMHALAVGLSRLVLRVHYPADVAAGLALGCTVAWAVHEASRRIQAQRLIAAVGLAAAALGLGAAAAGGAYRDIGIIAGAGLGLSTSPLALRALGRWEECLGANLSLAGRILAFTIAAAASAPAALTGSLAGGLAAGFSVGLLVPLSRPLACRLREADSVK